LRIDAQAGEGTAGVGGRYLCQGLAGAERERGGSGGSGGGGKDCVRVWGLRLRASYICS
jgi:hypothetical protein